MKQLLMEHIIKPGLDEPENSRDKRIRAINNALEDTSFFVDYYSKVTSDDGLRYNVFIKRTQATLWTDMPSSTEINILKAIIRDAIAINVPIQLYSLLHPLCFFWKEK